MRELGFGADLRLAKPSLEHPYRPQRVRVIGFLPLVLAEAAFQVAHVEVA